MKKTISDYHKFDFSSEIEELFRVSEFNFGVGAIPMQIVKQALLKSVCGWHNGSTAQSIIRHLKYVNAKNKITTKGKAFLWWAYGEGAR